MKPTESGWWEKIRENREWERVRLELSCNGFMRQRLQAKATPLPYIYIYIM